MENIIMKKKKNSKGLQSIHSPTNVPKPDFSSDHKNVTKLKKRDPEKIENLPHTVQQNRIQEQHQQNFLQKKNHQSAKNKKKKWQNTKKIDE